MLEHDDVNLMCVGAKTIGPWLARDLITAFIKAEFIATEDHKRRVQKLYELELAAARELKDKI